MDTPTPTTFVWPTLTPFPTSAATSVLDLSAANIPMAERLVQGYQVANNAGAMDLLIWAILLFLIIGGIWSIIRRLQSM
jgi:hypothetical protein